MELFARAWLDGYTVEEEHKYNVKFKGISGELNYLNYNSEIQKWYFRQILRLAWCELSLLTKNWNTQDLEKYLIARYLKLRRCKNDNIN